MCIVAITDEFDVNAISRLKQGIVEGSAHLDLTQLFENKWIVVPRLSASHFNEVDAALLSNALIEEQCSQLFGISTEPLANFPNCFAVTTSTNGLLSFSQTCAQFNFLMIPVDRSAAVLCTVYDYFLVAGPPQFVRHAVGGEIEEAWNYFEKEALDPWWGGRLQKVVKKYKDVSNGSA